MGVLSFLFSSSLGRKLMMAVTGVSLVGFLLVHCGINATVLFNDGGETFNEAAKFMATNWLIRTAEILLFVGLLWHIVQGLWLTFDNQKRREAKYGAKAGNSNSKWYSRSMGILGSILLIFLVVHLKHFWIVSRFGMPHHLTELPGGGEDLFAEMVMVFANPVPVVIYVMGCIGLAYHLLHGFGSAFQTLGINHKSYTPIIATVGTVFSIIVPLVFALIPVVMHLELIK